MSSSIGFFAKRGAEDGRRVALLPVALDDEARQGAGQEDELVPVRDLLEDREPAHAVAAELGLHVDVVDDLGREDPAPPEDLFRSALLAAAAAQATSGVSPPEGRCGGRPPDVRSQASTQITSFFSEGSSES